MTPEVPINYLAVLLGAVSNMVLGFLWYGPVFGKQWATLSGLSRGSMDASKKQGMNKLYMIATLTSLLMSYVLAHSLVFASTFTQTFGVSAGVMVGFWSWLGFIVPITVGTVLWEGKSWTLWLLNAGYYLVALVVMGVILATMA